MNYLYHYDIHVNRTSLTKQLILINLRFILQITIKDGEDTSSMVSGVVVPATLFDTAGKTSPRVSFAVYGTDKMFKVSTHINNILFHQLNLEELS